MNDLMVSRVSATTELWTGLPSPRKGSRNGTRTRAVANCPANPTKSVAVMAHDDRATPGRRPITTGSSVPRSNGTSSWA
jgi:hypothetical protein